MVKKPSLTAKRIYRKRVKKSPCRGKKKVSCKSTSGCKVSKGRKRSFCRKKLNTKRTQKVSFRITRRARHNRRRH